MANETDSEKGKAAPKVLDQGQPVERASVAPDGTISIPHGESKLTTVDVADVDLLLSFSDGTFVIIPNGALDAISEAPPNVLFNDKKATLGDLFKMVGISDHAKAGSLRVVSGNVDAPKTLEDLAEPKPPEKELVASSDVPISDTIAAPAPLVKVGKGAGRVNEPHVDTPVIISPMEGKYYSSVGRLLERDHGRVSALVDEALELERAVTLFLAENAYVAEVVKCQAQGKQFAVDLVLIQYQDI